MPPRRPYVKKYQTVKTKKYILPKLCSISCNSVDHIIVPVRLISEANNTDHWTKKRRRQKEIQRIVRTVWHLSPISNIKPPVLITLTRLAPRSLDYDNLVSAFKGVTDLVASLLIPGLAPGRADGDKSLTFEYKQEKSKKYGIQIKLNSL